MFRTGDDFHLILAARPSFIEGMARIFDFGNGLQLYNYSHSDAEADFKALRSDWESVGQDIEASMSKYGKA